MTDHDLQPRLHAAGGMLGLLTVTYPAFRFRRERVSPRRSRWIATRRNGCDPGVHTIVTADLGELRAALDEEARRAR